MVIFLSVAIGIILPISEEGQASDFMVYSVYRGLSLGPGDNPEKDYYINMGTNHGLHVGSTLVVYRRTPTYDLMSEQLYRDVTFPIAMIKIIHSESLASIARLEKMLPSEQTPVTSPHAIMVGDAVRLPE
jgi:hypothetical protein